MQEPQYLAPRSLAEAVAALSTGNGTVRALAGGTDLLVQLKTGRQRPETIVDVKRIPELGAISLEGDGLFLGASVSAAELGEHAEVRALWPGLVEAAELIGSTQIQGRASLGGNLCNASPAADTVPALVAAGATCVIAGPDGERTVPVESFCTGPGTTVLGPGELLVGFRIATPPARTADAYLRFIPRTEMDIAVVGASVSLTRGEDGACTAARVALGAVAPTVRLVPDAAAALEGARLEEDALERAAQAATAACAPIDDKRGTIDYRRRVAGVLTRRAAKIAFDRAGERS